MISVEERERAEKGRSAHDAAPASESLSISEQTVARYLAPPEETTHPLEYTYHLLGDVKGKTILDFGCGDGLNTVMLSRRGAKVIGVDLSPELLALAKQRVAANHCLEATLVLGSAHALPLRDESVDVVFGIGILHHLDLEFASREVQRVLKKGGRGIFKEPVRNSKLMARMTRLLPMRADVSLFEGPLTDQQIRDFAASCRYRGRTFHLILSRLATRIPLLRSSLLTPCEKLDDLLLRLFPSLTHYGSIRVFEIAKC
jgi:SAM-dependent methyltransferase